ncbi:urease accessory protein UreD [Piscinibacter sakaiensis]|uniref:urease accessory protein UreD n=1 Tax=Piscinibacter sakaiensis TaxID=1547922 RepID=UPI003AAF38A0
MGWHGRLALSYEQHAGTTVSRSRHHGPMRVLASLYPEGPAVCHQVLVHPPGGLVHGDVLELEIGLRAGSHVVLTTPGATRFYRSGGDVARQAVRARLEATARLEWLPLETICHRGTRAENELSFELAPGAEMIGWDTLALGLPASGEAFDSGSMRQQIQLPGIWLERALIDGGDRRLLDGPLGWAGRSVLGCVWFSRGDAIDPLLRERLLDQARELVAASPLAATAGATSTDARLVVLRVLAHRAEPVLALLGQVRAAWRQSAWQLDAHPPRIWRT